jgi:ERCC4-related helicase
VQKYINIATFPFHMTDLIVCLTNQKGVLEHVRKVIEDVEWQNIYIFTAEQDISNFKFKKKAEIIRLDLNKTISELAEFIKTQLQGKLNDLEVAINIVGGSGKEHTALISAVLTLGLGLRLVVLTPTGVKTI